MTILPVFFGAKTTEKVGWKVVLKRLKLRNMTAIEREQQTIKIMIGIYCHDHHHPSEELCAECQQLVDYALVRLQKCPFAPNKPTCKTCPVHCYKPSERERMRRVMRYAGPRMIWSHPLMAIRHLLNEIWRPKGRIDKTKRT